MPRTVGHPESELIEQHGDRLRSSGEPHHTLGPWHKDNGSAGTTGTPEHSELGSGAVRCPLLSVGVPHQDTAAFPLARPSALNLTSSSRALLGLQPKLLQACTQSDAPVGLTELSSAGKLLLWGWAMPRAVPGMLPCSTRLEIQEVSGGAWPALGKGSVLVSPQRNACPGHHKS